MRSPDSCLRCSSPLEIESASGLCLTCLRLSDTLVEDPAASPGRFVIGTGRVPLPAGDTSAPPADGPTATSDAAADTADPGPARLPEPPPGYDLLARLGGGGMGEVYLAREHATDRAVAMKFLRLAGSRVALDRFLVEVRALAALDHPHIVRILGTDFLRADPFFTMELAAGGSLGKWVERHGPPPPAAAARLAAVIARAVAAAHAKGILHRDLKPSNILLAGEPGGGVAGVRGGESAAATTPPPHDLTTYTPKVSDFGLAKRLDRDDGVTLGTGPLGTPSFMPPEQVSRKNGAVGPASDVYSLGATLYHLLIGSPPFGPGDHPEVLHAVLTDPVPRPRAARPDVPPGLDGIVVKCLEKDPADRYPDAAALADDLDRFLAGQVPAAPPMTPLRRARRWAARHRVRVAAAGLAVVAAAGLVAVGMAMSPEKAAAVADGDPAEAVRRELAAGRAVTVVGAEGRPRYHRWRLGGPEFGAATTGEPVCYYESAGYALLELVPDPGVDRYQVVLDVRHVGAAGGPGDPDPSWVGPYLGHAEVPTAEGVPLHAVLGVTYSDLRPNAADPAGTPGHVVRTRAAAVSLRPSRDPGLIQRVVAPPLGFAPAAGPVGDWRTFRVEVSPGGVRVEWAGPGGAAVPAAVLPADRVRRAFADLQAAVTADLPGQGAVVPEWSPRRPVGVWSYRAAVAVRNVVVSPL